MSPPESLKQHIERYWPIVEPATPFIDNWHIGAICEHLTAITDGEIMDLMIEMPPGGMKSLTTCVFWPTWEWRWRPWEKYLNGSYSHAFAVRDATRSRTIIESEEYKADNPGVFNLLKDTNQKDLYANDQSGYRMACGVGGGHGYRYTRVMGDDVLTPQTVESAADRKEVNRWWTEIIPGRASQPGKMARVLIGSRLSTKDLQATERARDLGYVILTLPYRFESKYIALPTKLGFTDPRHEEGELLEKNRVSEVAAKKLEKDMGFYGTAAQLQQRPIARGGDIKYFLRHRFESNIRVAYPNGLTLVRYWDKAFTAGGGAYTVGVLMGKTRNDDYWILDVKRGQWGNEVDEERYKAYHARLAEIEKRFGNPSDEYDLALLDKPMGYRDRQIVEAAKSDKEKYGRVKIYLEHEPGPQGRDSCAVLIKLLKGYQVEADPVKEDKTTRALAFSSQQLAGNVYLVSAPWNEPYIAELELFSEEAEYKDQVDASSGGFNKLVTAGNNNIDTGEGYSVV